VLAAKTGAPAIDPLSEGDRLWDCRPIDGYVARSVGNEMPVWPHVCASPGFPLQV
jgi:hypothetical protein